MKFKQWFTQQNDRDLGERIKRATQFSLSPEERTETREFLHTYMRMHPARTPTRAKSRLSWVLHPYPVIAGVLIFALAGGSAGAASLAEQALPGDLLYPIKVNVNEEVRAALATTPDAKADVAIARAERRIEELNTLAARGDIAGEVRAEIDNRIDEQVHAAEVKTSFVNDEEKEHRLVAMLRVHENLVAASEIGGSLEPTVTFATVAADTPATDTAESDNSAPEIALMIAAPATDTVTATPDVSKSPPEAARISLSAEIASTQKGATGEPKKNEKKVDDNAKNNIARQKKTAEQRIETLKNLLERKGKRLEKEVWAKTQSELDAAHAAYEEGVEFYDNGEWGEAAVRFNAAIRIAIDTRELLAKAVRVENKVTEKPNAERDLKRSRGTKED